MSTDPNTRLNAIINEVRNFQKTPDSACDQTAYIDAVLLTGDHATFVKKTLKQVREQDIDFNGDNQKISSDREWGAALMAAIELSPESSTYQNLSKVDLGNLVPRARAIYQDMKAREAQGR